MKIRIFIVFLIIILFGTSCADKKATDGHPYLLITPEKEISVKTAIIEDSVWANYHTKLIEGADKALSMPLCEKKTSGKKQKLLKVAREYLRRMTLWSYAYRMTGDDKYAVRAAEEIKNVASFSDWNPKHFLDAAEITTGMAVAYDSMYDFYDDSTKIIIEEAIVNKGLLPSLDPKYNNWLKRVNNWNQVCNGGMVMGALAVKSKYPELSDTIVKRSVESIKLAMASYAPCGAYPEGFMYWGYGTTYNLLMIDALKNVYGTDFGLSQMPGFLNTASFIQNIVLGDGVAFNYGDCENSGRLNPSTFWFAAENQDPSLLWQEKYFLNKKGVDAKSRFSALSIIWGASVRWKEINKPEEKMWVSKSSTVPIAMMRSNWDYFNGMSLAVKGGTAQSGHSHLDAGSFVFVNDGVRWAIDLGPQSYDSLDENNLDQWNKSQESDRWKVLRYNNLSHNTLSFDGKYQNVYGYCDIVDSFKDDTLSSVTLNLSDLYDGYVSGVFRKVSMSDSKYAVIEDSITSMGKSTKMRWNMVTKASPQIVDNKTILLKQDGHLLTLSVDSRIPVKMKTWSTDPINKWDAPNPGTCFVGFECELPPNSTQSFVVKLIP